jgi:hypothetical protein
MDEIGPQQRFSAHERQHAAAMVIQPVDGTARDVFRHAFDFVVEGPTVPAVEVALVFDKEIGRDGMKLAGQDARTNVRSQPPA